MNRTNRVATPERLSPQERVAVLIEQVDEQLRNDWIAHETRVKELRSFHRDYSVFAKRAVKGH